MPGIYVGNNENLENALRRFKRQIEKGGVLSDFKKKEFFEKPSEIKKKKLFAAKKRQNKKNRTEKIQIRRPYFSYGGDIR